MKNKTIPVGRPHTAYTVEYDEFENLLQSLYGDGSIRIDEDMLPLVETICGRDDCSHCAKPELCNTHDHDEIVELLEQRYDVKILRLFADGQYVTIVLDD